MLGPLYRIRNKDNYDNAISVLQNYGMSVTHKGQVSIIRNRIFGKVIVGQWFEGNVLHIGFGHPFSPWFWMSDSNLLKSVCSVFEECGMVRVTLNDV